ncbi:transposase, partial [Archaeoglobus sp.]
MQKRFYCGYKITCITDGKFLNILYVDTAKKHDLTVLKEKKDDFSERLKGKIVIADKGYISKKFAEEMEKRGVRFVAIKRE